MVTRVVGTRPARNALVKLQAKVHFPPVMTDLSAPTVGAPSAGAAVVTAPATAAAASTTALAVLFAISFSHLCNDMMQGLLPAIYPTLKANYNLSFADIGLVTFAFQFTASLLQPAIGLVADRRAMPYSLAIGMVSTLAGLLLLSVAGAYWLILVAAMLIGLGSAVFHPEASRVARMASGGRPGFAQSFFQVGGNTGTALGPLTAAVLIADFGQPAVAWYALVALTAILVLWRVGVWYSRHGIARMKSAAHAMQTDLPARRVAGAIAILLALIFSKYVYMASVTSYFTFYLIDTFHVSVQQAQVNLFLFLAAVAVGTLAGGPLGDRFGRKYVIWFSILGTLPFTLALPFANLAGTTALSMIIGVVLASAFPAIVVYAQELMPGKVGMVSGLFFGFAFGIAGIGAAVLGNLADWTSIGFVYRLCAFLPAIGLLAFFLPDLGPRAHNAARPPAARRH
jgi:FSR family fosmidomycin resistance protein-like MFS transporter